MTVQKHGVTGCQGLAQSAQAKIREGDQLLN